MLPKTPGFRSAVALGNQVADVQRDRFLPFLERIVDKLHVKDDRPFSEKEEKQLEEMFGVGADELHQLVSLVVYAFQQAAYHGHTGEELGKALVEAGGTKVQVKAMQHVWNNGSQKAIQILRAQNFGATAQLEGVDWRVQLQNAKGDSTAEAAPAAVLEFNLAPPASNPQKQTLAVELTKEEAYNLFLKLEQVQDQLDALN